MKNETKRVIFTTHRYRTMKKAKSLKCKIINKKKSKFLKKILTLTLVAVYSPSYALAANATLPQNGEYDITKDQYSAERIEIEKKSIQIYNVKNKTTFTTWGSGIVFDDGSDTTFNINSPSDDGYNLCVDNSGHYGAMNLYEGAKVTINKGKLNFSSLGSQVFKLYNDAQLNINADELTIQAKGLQEASYPTKSSALHVQNAKPINIKISDKFKVTSEYYSGIHFISTDANISAKSITVDGAYAKGPMPNGTAWDIRNGIDILQEDEYTSKINITATDDIKISGGSKGISIHADRSDKSTFNLVSENGNITIAGNKHGIIMSNHDNSSDEAENNIQNKITAANNVTVTSKHVPIYLSSNTTLLVQGNKSISLESTGEPHAISAAANVTESYLELNTPELILKSYSDLALDARHGGQVSINTSNASIYGNIKVDVWDWAEPTRETKVSINNSNLLEIHPEKDEAINVKGKGGIVDIESNMINMKGIIQSSNGAEIYITSTGATLFSGSTKKESDDIINFNFGNGSVWNIDKDSTLTSLTLRESTLDFDSNPLTVTTDNLISNNSTIRMAVGYNDNSWSSNKLIVNEGANGNLVANIVFDLEKFPVFNNPSYIPTWLVSQGENSKLSIYNYKGKNSFSGNGMVSVWALSFVPENQLTELDEPGKLNLLATQNTGVGAGKWFLIYADRESESVYPPINTDGDQNGSNPTPDTDAGNNQPNKPPVEDPAEIQQILDLGVSTMQAMSFASELDDLRTRTGEVRHGLSDGAWARASYQKDRIFGENSRTFKQETQDLHIGLDHLIPTSNDSAWLLGGALRYAKSDQKGVGQFTNEGDLQQYSAKLYATYLHDAGSYADFVIQAGRYDQELQGVANDGYSKFSADYKTYGYGLSAEFGHQFALGNGLKSLFNPFIEPQMQLSYFMAKGKDFTTSTGMKISQGDADFLTGRIGVVMGNTVKYGEGANPNFFQIAFTGGMKYEFMGDQIVRFTGVEGLSKTRRADDIGGARFYYGFMSDWKLTDSLRAFAKLEREEGHHYTKDYDASIGVRYAF